MVGRCIRIVAMLLAVIGLSLVCACNNFGEPSSDVTHTVSGTVREHAADSGVEGAEIKVLGCKSLLIYVSCNSVLAETSTDKNGRYSLQFNTVSDYSAYQIRFNLSHLDNDEQYFEETTHEENIPVSKRFDTGGSATIDYNATLLKRTPIRVEITGNNHGLILFPRDTYSTVVLQQTTSDTTFFLSAELTTAPTFRLKSEDISRTSVKEKVFSTTFNSDSTMLEMLVTDPKSW